MVCQIVKEKNHCSFSPPPADGDLAAAYAQGRPWSSRWIGQSYSDNVKLKGVQFTLICVNTVFYGI